MPEETQKPQRLDANAPLVVDVRRLGRRPGSMLEVSKSVPAPADLGLEVIGVTEGTAVELEFRLESVLEGVVVSGTARAELVGECVRCLEPIEDDLEVDFAELFVHPGQDGDDETRWLQDDMFDLEPVLRDAVVLSLPLQPVCEEDCPGLCSECGARLVEDPTHRHDQFDQRWAALEGLLGEQN
ncbi:MAG: YceD family protein [Sporichthyaceae bacterium]